MKFELVYKIPRKQLSLGLPNLCTGVFKAIASFYQLLGVATSCSRSPGVIVFEIFAWRQIPRKPLSLGSPNLCTGVFRAIASFYQLLGVVTSFSRSPGVNVFEI